MTDLTRGQEFEARRARETEAIHLTKAALRGPGFSLEAPLAKSDSTEKATARAADKNLRAAHAEMVKLFPNLGPASTDFLAVVDAEMNPPRSSRKADLGRAFDRAEASLTALSKLLGGQAQGVRMGLAKANLDGARRAEGQAGSLLK